MVDLEHARMVMETYSTADVSAEVDEPVKLPLSNQSLATLVDLKGS
ncbi:hypothetical protein KMP13_10010 [Epibacterium ulvae]|nr:hypothetical protein [Epibacterium ulvae]MBT8154224.1 hypothetical protein [Epibacterium ulvae]